MTTHPADPAVRGGPSGQAGRPGLALLVLAGAIALDVSALAVLNAALPDIRSDFHISSAILQWAMTAYAVTFAGFLLFGGRAADVLGRRLVFTAGVVLFSVAALGGVLAPNITVLVIARAVQGLGAALSGPAALALLTEVFPEGPQRNKAIAVYGSVGAASFSGGLIVGGALTEFLGWRAVFAFSTILGVGVLAAIRAGLPPSVRVNRPLDLPGAAMVTVGLVLTVFGVGRGGDTGWGDPGTVASLVAAVVLLVAFVLWERRLAEPLLPVGIFRVPTVQAATLAAFLHYAAVIALLFFAPLYMQGVLGYSPFQSGLAMVPMGLTVIVSSTITGRTMARVGQRPFLVYGMPLIGLGVLMWFWTPVDGSYWLNLLPGIIVMSIGQGTTFPALTAAALTGVPQRQHGIAGAVNVTTQQVGSSIGVAALVAVAAAVAGSDSGAEAQLAGFHAAYVVAAVTTFVGTAFIALALSRRPKTRPAPQGDADPLAV
ncbi:MFS transporter [Streptosporangium sp. NPDC001559]|uniref:MFS transporter n=1 Tax=Streptosporangium sp. NPDC001559 TaxID=3366187 RepID=UPI0036E40E3E